MHPWSGHLCLFMAKSQHYKQLGKLAIAPSLFGINEPVVFGFPMMFNAVTAVPFILLPVVLTGVSYALVAMGILPCGNGVGAPASIPVLMGFINMGWRGAVWNVIEVLITIAAYLPFFKVLDQQALEEEQAMVTAE